MTDNSAMKLGKAEPRIDNRTLVMAKYLMPGLPAPPVSVDWTTTVKASWGMMENDRYGDCTCAAAGHLIMEWTANAGNFQTVSDPQVIQAYAAITGFDPATGAGDHGAVELDVLNFWRKTGIAGHKIDSFVALTPGNTDHVKLATDLFYGAYIGLTLPMSAQQQDIWDVPPGGPLGPGKPGSWGGHAVCVVGYDATNITIITWGQKKLMTWGFWQAYCDEAYAMISIDYLKQGTTSPAGIDIATLKQDLQNVAA